MTTTETTKYEPSLREKVSQILVNAGLRTDQVAICQLVALIEKECSYKSKLFS